MSTSIRFVAAISLVVAVAACDTSPQEEFVVAEPDSVSIEPTYTGKYD
ncbi:MAG: hypothetical protein ABJH07_17480 [Sedimentitalea sp.]